MNANLTATADTISDSTKLRRIGFARLGAEGVSIGCAMGGMILSKSLLQGPVEPVKSFVARYLVHPYIGAYDAVLDRLPSIQTPDDKAQLVGKSSMERAQVYANGIVDFSVGLSSGFAGQIGGQILFDRITHVPEMNRAGHIRIAAIDRSAQLGAVLMLNTLLSRPSIALQEKLTNILQKQTGADRDTADYQSSFLVNWQLPNLAGMAAAILSHYQESKNMHWK